MIKGIGIDICDIKRLAAAIKKNKRFLKRVYSEREIGYCSGKRHSILNYAGRFAVKEAFIKAVSNDKTINLNQIEVVNNSNGKPEIVLNEVIKAVLKKKKGKNLSISISHTHDAAAAVCIIT
jgi:holo-[acyl-carrier protein] synthase